MGLHSSFPLAAPHAQVRKWCPFRGEGSLCPCKGDIHASNDPAYRAKFKSQSCLLLTQDGMGYLWACLELGLGALTANQDFGEGGGLAMGILYLHCVSARVLGGTSEKERVHLLGSLGKTRPLIHKMASLFTWSPR